jgi:CBS domain-containing membrane protein
VPTTTVYEIARDVPVEMLMEKNVQTVTPETPAASAAEILEVHKYGCLPVVSGGKLVGIVTETDFMRFARRYFELEARTAPRPSTLVPG